MRSVEFDVQRDPFSGIGESGPLKHELAGCWSRRIDQEHRLVSHVLPEIHRRSSYLQGHGCTDDWGVRKSGEKVLAAAAGQWHFGSDTKAMPAVMIARLIEQGKLDCETTLGALFPDLAPTFPKDLAAGAPVKIDQPWPHRSNAEPTPMNGPAVDNPPLSGRPVASIVRSVTGPSLWRIR